MILHHRGFPIRKSADITLIYNSPQLIAVNRVLHRLLMPRHSPCALVRLNFPMLFSLELYEFHLNMVIFLFVKRLNCLSLSVSTLQALACCGEIVVNYPNIGKTLNSIDLVNLMSSISVRFNSFSFFIRFSMNIKFSRLLPSGRSGWTRTIDLTLIRRAL